MATCFVPVHAFRVAPCSPLLNASEVTLVLGIVAALVASCLDHCQNEVMDEEFKLFGIESLIGDVRGTLGEIQEDLNRIPFETTLAALANSRAVIDLPSHRA